MTNYIYFEDDLMSRQVMEVILTIQTDGNNVIIHEDTTDFITKAQHWEYEPDIFLLDIHIQPHSGFDVLKALRQHPDFKDTKIIALTASVMNEEVQLLREAGFDGVIGKPVDNRTFPDLVNRILAGEAIWAAS